MTAHENAKRKVKIAISALYFVAATLFRFVLQAFGQAPKRKLVILYYHAVPKSQRLNFARQMESLRRSAQVAPAFYRGNLPLGKQNVAITFDDAFVSVAENALPELAARGFHCTIFVPAGLLGSRPTWAMESGSLDADETVMSPGQIATLPSPIVAVGSHSNTHPRLSRLNRDDARSEIEGSRCKLQELVAEEIQMFAFPYGDYDNATVELCRTAGYEYVFSITPRPVDTTANELIRGRVKVEPFDGRLEFFLKYNGAYAWASHAFWLKRKVKAIFEGFRFHFPIPIPANGQ